MQPDEASRTIAEALRSLPPDPAVEGAVITERIALHARLLGGMVQADPAVSKRFQSVGPSATAKRLKSIEGNLSELVDLLASLNGPEFDAFAQSGVLIADLGGTLSKVLGKMPSVLDHAKGAVGKLGRPTDDFGIAVTAACATAFVSITGREPTLSVSPVTNQASGPFFDLVSVIFRAVGVDGRPEARAKKAIEERRASRASVETWAEARSDSVETWAEAGAKAARIWDKEKGRVENTD